MLTQFKRFLKNESGAAAIEYGLLASGISVAIIPSVKNIGQQLARCLPRYRTRSEAASISERHLISQVAQKADRGGWLLLRSALNFL